MNLTFELFKAHLKVHKVTFESTGTCIYLNGIRTRFDPDGIHIELSKEFNPTIFISEHFNTNDDLVYRIIELSRDFTGTSIKEMFDIEKISLN